MNNQEDWDCEDWADDHYSEDYDLEEDFNEAGTAPCPECGGEIQLIVEQCQVCGYWLTEADRRRIDGPRFASEGLSTMAWIVASVVAIGLAMGALLAVFS